jgi:hypothetical protein
MNREIAMIKDRFIDVTLVARLQFSCYAQESAGFVVPTIPGLALSGKQSDR